MDCSTPGFPVLHCLLEHAQTHVHWVNDAIQPSHPLSTPVSSCSQSFPPKKLSGKPKRKSRILIDIYVFFSLEKSIAKSLPLCKFKTMKSKFQGKRVLERCALVSYLVKIMWNQPWIFIRRTDAEAQVFWPPNAKSWCKEMKRPWCWERFRAGGERGATENEMVGWHHRLNGHEFEQALGDSEGQGRDMTVLSNSNKNVIWWIIYVCGIDSFLKFIILCTRECVSAPVYTPHLLLWRSCLAC